MKSIYLILIACALPCLAWSQVIDDSETRWGGRNGVEVIERPDSDDIEILQNGAPIPADQIRRGENFVQIFGPAGELNLEMRLSYRGDILWVWNPAYGDYGMQPQVGGIDPASLERADQRLNLDKAAGGFYVKSVKPNSSADLAGLQPYDQIVAIAAQPLASPVSLAEALKNGIAQLTVLRDGKKLELSLQRAY